MEISRYLEKHKDQLSGKTEDEEQIAEIVGLLRNMQRQYVYLVQIWEITGLN